jgi:hypothetical protein
MLADGADAGCTRGAIDLRKGLAIMTPRLEIQTAAEGGMPPDTRSRAQMRRAVSWMLGG